VNQQEVHRPYVLLSVATSMDGYLDDMSTSRLTLSNEADLDRVDLVRAGCDAILVGAGTIRADNPHLLVRSKVRRVERLASGLPASPVKVALTRSGDLDPLSRFFTSGHTDKIVYCAPSGLACARARLSRFAIVEDAGDPPDLERILADLGNRGIRRLMVEGGTSVHTQFLSAGLADELHLVVAPLFVGDSRAPRFVEDGSFPWNRDNRALLVDTRQIGDVALLRYALSERFQDVAR
jgi:5-amino-6-(5-phosphoribosylamino)uracil reductase